MSGEVIDIYPTQWIPTMAVSVVKALGYARVAWPSGRTTLEMYGGNVVVSDLERAMARGNLALMREENLRNTMRDFRARTLLNGYWIRSKHRRKARKIEAVEWIRPSAYDGPSPDSHGVLGA